jgi:RHS repeat-associated protein
MAGSYSWGGVGPSGVPIATAAFVQQANGATEPLMAHLNFGRAGHTATVLPDGRVLVLGGVGADGKVVTRPELFDPEAKRFTIVPNGALMPRTEHSATVMTDGRVLIAGGLGENGQVLDDVEVLDTTSGKVERLNPKLETARFGHFAALLPSSPVLVWGGFDNQDHRLNSAEFYDPKRNQFISAAADQIAALISQATNDGDPSITGGIPVQGATDFPIDGLLSVRFSKRLQASSINDITIALYGPNGLVKSTVVAAEAGMLAFITPQTELEPGADYTLMLNGPIDVEGRRLPFGSVSFRTATISAANPRQDSNAHNRAVAFGAPAVGDRTSGSSSAANMTAGPVSATSKALAEEDREEWIPGPQNYHGYWQTDRKPASKPKTAMPSAGANITALSGLVLRLNGKPLANVSLSVGENKTVSDQDGYFLLSNVPAGRQTLVIEGSTADRADASYGYFETLVDIRAGQTNALPFTIWIPKLDTEHTVNIPSPTTEEVVVTSPYIPGFEVRIPAGVVLRDRHGKVVTKVGITPVPLDRSPFPQPMTFSVYYTIQPGGAVIQPVDRQKPTPAALVYPNYVKGAPGAVTNAWLYDPFDKGWYIYGHGRVSERGDVVNMEHGVGFYEFTMGAHTFENGPGMAGPPPCAGGCCKGASPPDSRGGAQGSSGMSDAGGCGSDEAGDPVSISSGLFIRSERDLTVNDITPLTVLRVYRQGDPNLRMFGYGWSSPLDWNLSLPVPTDFSRINLVLPNGMQVQYDAPPGSSCCGAIYLNTTSPGIFYGSTLATFIPAAKWRLTLRDGRTYFFSTHPGALIGYADRFGNTTTVTRNSASRITRITGPTGRWIAFSLNPDGTVAQASDATGRTYTYAYQNGLLQSVTDPVGGIRQFTYDASQRLRTITDETGNITVTNDYDANGRVMMQTYANSATMQFAYTTNANGKVTEASITDQRGNVRQVSFDSLGYIASSTFPVGKSEEQTTTFTRDPVNGRLLTSTDPLSRITTYTYDASGNLASVTRLAGTPDAVTTAFTYEPYFNQLSSVTDPLNHTWAVGFDSAHNPVSVTDPLGHVTARAFNSVGQLTSVTDANSHTTTFAYSGPDLLSVTDALGRVTSLSNDTVGRLIDQVDPLGALTKLDYDGADRLVKSTEPNGSFVTRAYDLAGRLTSNTDENNNATGYAYGVLGLVTSRTDALTNVESWSYDVAGKLNQVIDRKGQVSGFTYDNRNRLSQVGFGATVSSPTTFASTVGYTYDAADRPTQVSDSTGGVITRTYDGLDRLSQEQTPDGTISYTYDSAGRRVTMTVAGQPTVSYTWDDANRLTQITQGTDVVSFTYDNASRRTSTILANGVAIAYGYDDANQLTSIMYTKGATTIGDLAYTYDAAGRRTSVSGSLAATDLPAAVASAVYNANNQLTSWAGTALTYDLNGNMTGDGTNTYTWNARDELASISGGASASFVYDGLGRRRAKTVAGVETGFVYDGENFVQELNGATVTANLVTGGIDELFARKEGSTASYPLTDVLGSVIGLTDASGVLQTQYSYEPYGKATRSGAATTNSQTYTGREDDGNDLSFYRARYYMPKLDRFVQEDPARLRGGSADLYAYVGGNPISTIDPLGLKGFGISAGGSAELSGAGAFQANSGIGAFWGGGGGLNGGGYTANGGFDGRNSDDGVVIGATVGLGVGLFITNAQCAKDLLGPFETWTLNLPIVSLQFAESGGIWTGGFSIGKSWGVSVSRYTVTTTTASGCSCHKGG